MDGSFWNIESRVALSGSDQMILSCGEPQGAWKSGRRGWTPLVIRMSESVICHRPLMHWRPWEAVASRVSWGSLWSIG